jgi:hypothetical protein
LSHQSASIRFTSTSSDSCCDILDANHVHTIKSLDLHHRSHCNKRICSGPSLPLYGTIAANNTIHYSVARSVVVAYWEVGDRLFAKPFNYWTCPVYPIILQRILIGFPLFFCSCHSCACLVCLSIAVRAKLSKMSILSFAAIGFRLHFHSTVIIFGIENQCLRHIESGF